MTQTLVKIAKQLNVGIQTIVEYLGKHGFEVEGKPNAKISDEMYSELLKNKEFQASLDAKEKANQITIGVRPAIAIPVKPMLSPPPKPSFFAPPMLKKEPAPVAVEPTPPLVVEIPKVVEPPVAPPPVAVVEAPSVVQKPSVEPVAESVVVEKVRPSLKILGKIDLNPVRKTTKPEVKASQPQPVKEEGRSKAQGESSTNKEVSKEAIKAPKPTVAPQPPVLEAKIPVAEPKAAEPTPPPAEEEMHRAKTPLLKGLKILGKIDTEKFDRKPAANTRGGRDAGRNRNPGAPATAANGSNSNAPGSVLSEEEKKKRRRKRKKVTTAVSDGRPVGQGNGNNQGGGNNQQQGGGDNRGQQGNSPNYRGNNNNAGGGNTRPPQGGGGNSRPPQGGNRTGQNTGQNQGAARNTEVSKKVIEDQIKATMARLSGGKTNKRQKMRRGKRDGMREKQERLDQELSNSKLQLTEFVTVSELASLLDVAVSEVIMTCMNLGVIVSINQRLDAEIIELVAEEFDTEVEFISAEETIDELLESEDLGDPADYVHRAPIVTVMGHVDHGKTSLLDYIRSAKVASGEAGGITQHIGAYEVTVQGDKHITFLDTPGHEAFTAMRARGAKVTDIAVVIISADDNIMPQTKEAISHAQAANVPMVFAINKIDKAGADPEKIKNELAQMNFLVEDWGGKYQSQDISAKQGTNVDALLEKILLEAEILELKANPKRKAVGTVIEASLDKGRGYVTKMLVQEGTLKMGDAIVAGEHSGKVKAMFNELGKRVKTAGPAAPVLVLGLSGAPQAGEKFKVMEGESEARQIASRRAQISREQANRANKRISLEEIGRRLALGSFKELNLIVKGDVDGSVEALADSLIKQSIESVQVRVIHKAVGQIIESDILLASASDAIIIGFQVRPSLNARKLAEREGVEIKTYSIIYEAIEEIRSAIEGMLEPTKEEKIVGQIEVREIFKISKIGTIAGCYVQEGKFTRNTLIRVIRDGIVVFPVKEGVTSGELSSLKRYKEDAKEVKSMMECGLTIKGFNDIQVGDTVEGFEIIEVKQKLEKR